MSAAAGAPDGMPNLVRAPETLTDLVPSAPTDAPREAGPNLATGEPGQRLGRFAGRIRITEDFADWPDDLAATLGLID